MSELVTSFFVITSELVLVFAIALSFALFYIVKVIGGARSAANKLIAMLQEGEAERQQQRVTSLRSKFNLDEDVAKNCATQLLALEKSFYSRLANCVSSHGQKVNDVVEEVNRVLLVSATVASDHVGKKDTGVDDKAVAQLKEQNQALNEENERLADELASAKEEIEKVVEEYTQMYDHGTGTVDASDHDKDK